MLRLTRDKIKKAVPDGIAFFIELPPVKTPHSLPKGSGVYPYRVSYGL